MKKLVKVPVIAVAGLLLALAAAGQERLPAASERHDHADERGAVVDWINEERAAAGLEPLAADPRLFEVAQRRAETLAAAGSVETDQRALQAVSRELHGRGYEAHRWTERAIFGYAEPVAMVRRWGADGEATFADTTLGPYEDLGVGVAEAADGARAISLLFAVPRSTELTRISEPLRDLASVRAAVLARTNRARSEEGKRLSALRENDDLDRAAQAYAERMLHEDFYAHVAPDGSDPAGRAAAVGYGPYLFLAENIAQGLFEPAEMVERWMASSHHRRNILHPRAEEMGLGLAFGETDHGFRVIWVQMLGQR